MTDDNTLILTNHEERVIRLTAERFDHILERPEMYDQLERIREAVETPQIVVVTTADPSFYAYHR